MFFFNWTELDEVILNNYLNKPLSLINTYAKKTRGFVLSWSKIIYLKQKSNNY